MKGVGLTLLLLCVVATTALQLIPKNFVRRFAMKVGQPDRQYLDSVFQSVDKDRSGHISSDELDSALSNGAWKPFNQETVRYMIGMFDRNQSGRIDFDEFANLWKYVTDWQGSIRGFDRDNSGNIDRGELSNALTTFDYRLSEPSITILMKRFDRNGTGVILFDDFIQCCVVLHTLTSAFGGHDTDIDGVITIQYEQFLTMVLSLKL